MGQLLLLLNCLERYGHLSYVDGTLANSLGQVRPLLLQSIPEPSVGRGPKLRLFLEFLRPLTAVLRNNLNSQYHK